MAALSEPTLISVCYLKVIVTKWMFLLSIHEVKPNVFDQNVLKILVFSFRLVKRLEHSWKAFVHDGVKYIYKP